ncbi:GlxA family transcriptional regulator [Roseovarius sp. D0-M9]|uniref:GlxA family transcriptional regulator n=1 Tax=Roseovarius sp. D0-M9 TaxID=3127117 RepID=UPI0030103EA1
MFHSIDPNGYVAVVVLDGFSALSFGSIVEPFSFLAKSYPEIAPRLILVGLDGRYVRSQSGVAIECDEDAEALITRLGRGRTPASLIICSDTEARIVEKSLLLSLLRLATRNGVSIYGVGSVNWLIAETGILKGGKGTVHWKSLAAFAEQYSDVDSEDVLFVSNGMVVSCAGESATLDMVLDIIGSISPQAAEATANQLLVSLPRRGNTSQPGSKGHRLRNVPQNLSNAVRVMAYNIESPLQAAEVADKCGIPIRRLERMFQNHLGTSPMQYYTQLRLEFAHDLLMQTNMTILNVSVASGFCSHGALTKKFRRRYGETPSQRRMKAWHLNVAEAH